MNLHILNHVIENRYGMVFLSIDASSIYKIYARLLDQLQVKSITELIIHHSLWQTKLDG